MELDKLVDLVNEYHRDEGGLDFPKILQELPEGLKEQSSEIPEVDKEWVKQYVDQFDNYSGTLAYQLGDGRFLTFNFWG